MKRLFGEFWLSGAVALTIFLFAATLLALAQEAQ